MLTIDEIRNIAFRTNIRGYNQEDVDNFTDEVILTVEFLRREKADLIRKMDILAKRVEQYRDDEETVRNALLSSQKVADACIKEANEKAKKINDDAKQEAADIILKANVTASKQKDNYTALLADAVKLRDELLFVYKKHISIIEELPTEVNLESKIEELDRKYPTEITEEPVQEAVEEEQPEQLNSSSNSIDAFDDDNNDDLEQTIQISEVKNTKFDDLKFGDNYDVGNKKFKK